MSCRGPIPDKPAGRPTVPEAVEALRAYYRLPGRGNGGAVHIILEDGNTGQGDADWCVAHAAWWSAEWGVGGATLAQQDRRVAELLAAMTGTQRRRLAAMSFYP